MAGWLRAGGEAPRYEIDEPAEPAGRRAIRQVKDVHRSRRRLERRQQSAKAPAPQVVGNQHLRLKDDAATGQRRLA